jgi:hypothetical protein
VSFLHHHHLSHHHYHLLQSLNYCKDSYQSFKYSRNWIELLLAVNLDSYLEWSIMVVHHSSTVAVVDVIIVDLAFNSYKGCYSCRLHWEVTIVSTVVSSCSHYKLSLTSSAF